MEDLGNEDQATAAAEAEAAAAAAEAAAAEAAVNDETDTTDTGADDTDTTDTGDTKVEISQAELNHLKMIERLVKKQSDSQEPATRVAKPEVTQDEKDTRMLAELKKSFPQYNPDQLAAIFKISQTVADTTYRPIAQEATDNKLKTQILDFSREAEISKEDTAVMLRAITNPKHPNVKRALQDGVITAQDMFVLLDYERVKKELNDLRVKTGQTVNNKKGFANAGGKPGVKVFKKPAGTSKYKTADEIEAMSPDEYSAYQKTLGQTN
jgi:hypothetical protein